MLSSNEDIAVFETVARQDRSLNWYAIADAAQHCSLPSVLTQSGREAGCLLGASQGSPVAKRAPHLVQLCSPLEPGNAWSWIALKAKLKPCVSVIAAPTSFGSLFRQLTSCTSVVMPDGDSMYFAFWDPAILATLVGQNDDLTLHVKGPVLTPDQRSTLTRELTKWWYWDRVGCMHAITMEPASHDVLQLAPITLTQQQVDSLVEASVPDHILYYLESNQPLLIADFPYSVRYETVRKALAEARSIGLLAMADLVNFVSVALIYGVRMQNDSAICDLLSQVKRGELSFRSALNQFP